MRKFLKFTFLFFTIVLAVVSCKKDNTDTINPYDEQGLVLINKVSEQCETYVEVYLQQYFSQNTNANINELINNVKSIAEVEEASPNDDVPS